MVGLPTKDEVVKKSCQRQDVPTMEVTSNSDTTTDGLSELTTRQNPNPKNSDLFYGSDTMNSLIFTNLQRRCNIHIYTLVLGQKRKQS